MTESSIIPPHKRDELNQTSTGREAVRVIDTLDALNTRNQELLKEAAAILSLVRESSSLPMSEKLLRFIDKCVSPW